MLCFPGLIPVLAETYYVHPQGSDLNPGTFAQPWQSLDKIKGMSFLSGDSLLFSGNATFDGSLELTGVNMGIGTALLVSSYGEGRAVIAAGNGHGILLDGCRNMILEHLVITGSGRLTGNSDDGVILRNCRDIHINDLDISGFQHSGLLVTGASQNVEIRRVNAHDNGFAGIHVYGPYPDKALCRNLYIGYCRAENNPGDPTVTNNHSGNGILVGVCDSVLIEYCEAVNNGWDMPRKGNGPVGIWAWHADHVTIQRCISHHNKTSPGAADGGGFDLDGGVTNSVVQYCLSYANQGAGYGLFEYQGAEVWENNSIRYNISINDGTSFGGVGAAVWNGQNDNQRLRNLYFHNNVFYNDLPQGKAVVFWEPYYSDVFFYNNVFLTSGPAISGPYSAARFTGNVYWNFGKPFNMDGNATFTEWAYESGKEIYKGAVAGMNADPMLYAPGMVDITDPEEITCYTLKGFQLLPGSPLRDKGFNLGEILSVDMGTFDFFGDSIPVNKYDIGIHEYRNIPPIITSRPYTSVMTGQSYRYQLMTIDPNAGDTLISEADSIPSWLAFTDSSGLLTGKPSAEDTGTCLVSLSVSDGSLRSYQEFNLIVKNENDAPEFLSVPDTVAYEDCSYDYKFQVADTDTLDTIMISIETKPGWLEFYPDTRQLAGIPGREDTGGDTVVICASDGIDSVRQVFILTVINTNDPPTFTSMPLMIAFTGNTYNYLIKVSDQDGTDTLNYAAPALPGWLSFNTATGLLSGIPDTNDLGYCRVQISVSDAFDTISQSFVIQVIIPGNPFIADPGFEIYGVSGSWKIWTDGGMVSIEITNVHNGVFAARLTGYYTDLYQLVDVLPHHVYILKAWINTGNQDGVWFGVKNYGGKEVGKYIKSSTWVEAEISFETGDNPSPAEIYIWKDSGDGSIFVDDFSIQTLNTSTGEIPELPESYLGVIYPNPAKAREKIVLDLGEIIPAQDILINISDISGRCLYRQRHANPVKAKYTIDLQMLNISPGLYYISMINGVDLGSWKLIITD